LQEYPNSELLQMAYVKWLMKLQVQRVATEENDKERIYAEMMCRIEKELGIPFYRGAMQMIDYYLRSDEEEQAAACFEEYVKNVNGAEECLKNSKFFGDLGEDIRFISNGALVSLEAFREEVVQLMKNPAYMKCLHGNERLKKSMEKLVLSRQI